MRRVPLTGAHRLDACVEYRRAIFMRRSMRETVASATVTEERTCATNERTLECCRGVRRARTLQTRRGTYRARSGVAQVALVNTTVNDWPAPAYIRAVRAWLREPTHLRETFRARSLSRYHVINSGNNLCRGRRESRPDPVSALVSTREKKESAMTMFEARKYNT